MRVLRSSPRPYIVLGTIYAAHLLFLICLGVSSGKWLAMAKIAAIVAIAPILLIGLMAPYRVEVDEQEIRILYFGNVRQRARFADVWFSEARLLAEKDWPVSVILVALNEEDQAIGLMKLGLKTLRKADVQWLLALPQLKLRDYPHQRERATNPARRPS